MSADDDNTARAFSVYVAASAGGDSYPRVTAAIAALRAEGFTVTCTWPEVVAATPGGANPRDATVLQRRGWSTTDLAEIDAADALWFLVPEMPATTRGAWFEAGYAYSSHKHVVFSGDTKQSVFCALGVEFSSDAAALAHLRWLRSATYAFTFGSGSSDDRSAADSPAAGRSSDGVTATPAAARGAGELLDGGGEQ
jgi:hypothetical protein